MKQAGQNNTGYSNHCERSFTLVGYEQRVKKGDPRDQDDNTAGNIERLASHEMRDAINDPSEKSEIDS